VAGLKLRLALGVIAAAVTATALYALLRALQYYVFPDPNPANVVWSAHAGYFWRCISVLYAGGMAAILTFWAAGRDAARVTRVLARALPVAAALLAAQSLLWP
jgi:hypothetical protein